MIRLAVLEDEIPADVWEDAEDRDVEAFETESSPVADASYSETAAELTRSKSYAGWNKTLKEALYRNAVLTVLSAPELKESSRPGETEGDFRVRLSQSARERRDTEVERLRGQYASKINTLTERIRKAEQRRDVEAQQASNAKTGALISAGMAAIGALFSRKKLSSTNLGKAATSVRAASGRPSSRETSHGPMRISTRSKSSWMRCRRNWMKRPTPSRNSTRPKRSHSRRARSRRASPTSRSNWSLSAGFPIRPLAAN